MQPNAGKLTSQVWPMAPALLILSFVTNLTVLVSPLFMMHVLDRVVPSGNLSTLGMLALLAALALITAGFVEFFRDEAMSRAADWLHGAYSSRALAQGASEALPSLRDASNMQGFFSGRTGSVLLDLPWTPMFLLALFLIHPYFLMLAGGAIVIFALLAFLGHLMSNPKERAAEETRRSGMQAMANLDALGSSGTLMGLGANMSRNYLSSLNASKRLSASANRAGMHDPATRPVSTCSGRPDRD